MCDGIEIPRIAVTVTLRDEDGLNTTVVNINDEGQCELGHYSPIFHADEMQLLARLAAQVRDFALSNIQDGTATD